MHWNTDARKLFTQIPMHITSIGMMQLWNGLVQRIAICLGINLTFDLLHRTKDNGECGYKMPL